MLGSVFIICGFKIWSHFYSLASVDLFCTKFWWEELLSNVLCSCVQFELHILHLAGVKSWQIVLFKLPWRVCACVWCSCGDAVCTIAASTTFSEPFVTPMDRRRLDWVHKSLAGTRCSDHVALLHAFQLWEDARFVLQTWVWTFFGLDALTDKYCLHFLAESLNDGIIQKMRYTYCTYCVLCDRQRQIKLSAQA